MSVSGTTLSIAQNNNSRTLTVTLPTSGQGGGEPDAYLKDASASGNTLTITKKNGTQVTFTPSVGGGGEPAQYIKTASASGNTLTLTPNTGSAITFTPSVTGGGGSTVSLERILNSGTQIAKFTIDGTETMLYAPTPSSGGGDTYYYENDYDDTDLKNAVRDLQDATALLDTKIADANTVANSERTRLDGVINTLDSKIKNKVEGLFADATWWQQHYPGGGGSSSNFGQADVEAYLQQIGVWTTDDNGNTVTQWSKLSQTVSSLQSKVDAIVAASDGDYTALQTALEQYVDTKVGSAVTNISNTYAKVDDVEGVIEWMYSALHSGVSADKTYAQIVAAGKDNTLGTSAISELRTTVNKIDGEYVAESSLESKVDDAISGLYNSASSNNAKTYIFSKISKNSEDIATIITEATGDSSSASIATKFANWKSGLVTTSDLNSATASLVTQNELTNATSGLALKSELNSAVANLVTTTQLNNATSGLLLKSEFDTAKAELVAKNDFTAASIVAKVNGDSSNIKINADKVDVSGLLSGADGTFIGDFYARYLAFGQIDSSSTTGAVYDSGWGGLKFGSLSGNTTDGFSVSDTCVYIGAVSSGYGWINLKGSGNYNTRLDGHGLEISENVNPDQETHSTSTPSSSNTGAIYDNKGFEAYTSNGHVCLIAGDSLSHLIVSDSDGSVTLRSSGNFQTSDIRLKTIIEDINISAENLKDAPLFKYKYKNGSTIKVGTSAQYWQEIIPDAVIEGSDGYLSLDYTKVATFAAITAVKEIATLKAENTALKERVEALEARLQVIESKLNA